MKKNLEISSCGYTLRVNSSSGNGCYMYSVINEKADYFVYDTFISSFEKAVKLGKEELACAIRKNGIR